ncbi:MAG: ATP phosphoribosyltransferase regulatory subunit [Prochlorococcus sp.]
MGLQPAAGARDLNPQQVETNHQLREQLATVYRLWGYDEVSPPRVERLDTLMAGGAIDSRDIVRLVADEPLGLRPEMTASIARSAGTRLGQRPRPLRLWASGTVFESHFADEGGLSIEETLQSGVELFGVKDISAEMELLSLLIEAVETLPLSPQQQPSLLIGHTGVMDLILSSCSEHQREAIRSALVHFDRFALEQLNLPLPDYQRLVEMLDQRGEPEKVLASLMQTFGSQPALENLQRLFELLLPLAAEQGICLQLDPTFHPHFELYNGLVFQLVCQGDSAPVVIARGGRYDGLVARFGAEASDAGGAGFSFAIDAIRELLSGQLNPPESCSATLVAFSAKNSLEQAFKRQRALHQQGRRAVVEFAPCADIQSAGTLLAMRGCRELDWLD